mgnify:CR=1 FL=1
MTTNRHMTSEETKNRILEHFFSGKSSPQIRDAIIKEEQLAGRGTLPGFNPNIPEVRTIQRVVQNLRSNMKDEEIWSIEIHDPQIDTKIVLDTLAEVAVGTRGKVTSFTKAQASWLSKIRTSTSGLSGWGAWAIYKLSIEGSVYEKSGPEIILAFRPWESDKRKLALEELIESGQVNQPDCWGFIKDQSELMRIGLLGQVEDSYEG